MTSDTKEDLVTCTRCPPCWRCAAHGKHDHCWVCEGTNTNPAACDACEGTGKRPRTTEAQAMLTEPPDEEHALNGPALRLMAQQYGLTTSPEETDASLRTRLLAKVRGTARDY